MRFGPTPLEDCNGAILAHGCRAGRRHFKKGRLLDAEDLEVLRAAGVTMPVVARLEAGDVPEDVAAARLAGQLAGHGIACGKPFTGRANLIAEASGIVEIDRAALDRLNRLDEGLTIATLAPFARVDAGSIVATVKVIPFALPHRLLDTAESLVSEAGTPIGLHPFRPCRAALVMTRLPHLKPKVYKATEEATRGRISGLGSTLVSVRHCSHDAAALRNELDALATAHVDLILVAGASAIVDRRDIVPAAVEAAGGRVGHLGMPVDPGNLLMLGRIGDAAVLGLPGCARSPRINGIDWVLERLCVGLEVTDADIAAMGVGGLLKEMPSRPQPRRHRASARRAARAAAVVLAAGLSRRMGKHNKLLMPVDGGPMVCRVVDAALESKASPVVVVLGSDGARVRAALGDRNVTFVDNPDFETGMASSLRVGLGAVRDRAEAAIFLLADMPDIRASTIDALIAAIDEAEGRLIAVPVHRGKRGNPVIWHRRYFDALMTLEGDRGAKPLLAEAQDSLAEVVVDDPGILLDIDTSEALAQRKRSERKRNAPR